MMNDAMISKLELIACLANDAADTIRRVNRPVQLQSDINRIKAALSDVETRLKEIAFQNEGE